MGKSWVYTQQVVWDNEQDIQSTMPRASLYATVSILARTDWLSTVCNQWCIEAVKNKWLSGFEPIRSLPLRTQLRTIGKLLNKSYCSLKRLFTNLLCLMATVADVLCLALEHFRLFFSEELTHTSVVKSHAQMNHTQMHEPPPPVPKGTFWQFNMPEEGAAPDPRPWFSQSKSSSRVLKLLFPQLLPFPHLPLTLYLSSNVYKKWTMWS